jgi:methylmalonyl-CoA mutase N-terminal domain/subunit
MEERAESYFETIDALGGVIPAIEAGFFQREIADAAYRYQRELDAHEKVIVGINDFVEEGEVIGIPILEIPPGVEAKQRERMAAVRQSRNAQEVRRTLGSLKQAAHDGTNLMPCLLECTRTYVTLGEMCGELAAVFGVHQETPVF